MTFDATRWHPVADARRARLALALRQGGVTDPAVLAVMEHIPRDQFVLPAFADQAWDDTPLPIESGQTISQPLVVARMTAALALNDRHKVLEIGTGSGYQTAILARLARRVYSIERYKTLLDNALVRLADLGLRNVVGRHGDGGLGWPEQAPFDRIIVTAACAEPPHALLDQLKDGGICVAPVTYDQSTHLCVFRRMDRAIDVETLGDAPFVPLLQGIARDG